LNGTSTPSTAKRLLPAALGAIAGLLVPTQGQYPVLQSGLLSVSLICGVVAGWYALRAFEARKIPVGPQAQRVVAILGYSPVLMRRGIAQGLSRSIVEQSDLAHNKGRHLNLGMRWAGICVVLLAAARIVGGIP
jgi:hypothetical protein